MGILINKTTVTTKISIQLILVAITLITSCKTKTNDPILTPTTNYIEGEELSGGAAGTTFDVSVNAFNNAIPGLNFEENTNFVIGNSLNRNNWVTAPASTTGRDGLGPLYNAASCAGCHALDGRGRPPLTPNEGLSSMVIRLSILGIGLQGEPVPVPDYGDQLNTKGIQNVPGEGDVTVNYKAIEEAFPDGEKYNLRSPIYEFINLAYGSFPSGVMFSPRIAPRITGPGILDGISEMDILSYEDPFDANKDGISGKANMVWDEFKKQKVVGRVGWKANQPNVKHQVAHALLGDMGITSSMFSEENLWGMQIGQFINLPTGGKPEISDTSFFQMVYYASALAMPARRDYKDETVLKGKTLFAKTGCVKCHRAQYITANNKEVPQLSNQTIYPYSDLLLHDMGEELSDNRPDNEATGKEWRTAPLWGLGLSKVKGEYYLLHDGRARSIQEAILWHYGEALDVKKNYMKLDKTQRAALNKFVESL